jgi:tRNA-dihydrouridine synthase 1
VADHCDAVDLNLGCPQGIAKRGQYGAFLQEDWDLIYKLVHKLHTELPIPVTVKFRIQETKEKTLEYAKMILSAGASIITVHGRRREQKGHNTGVANWTYIRYLRDNLPPDTVIFANGNILNHDNIETCLEETGADGVMSAEGNLSDPTIFSKPPPPGTGGRDFWRGRDGKGGYRVDAIMRRYLDIIYKYILEQPVPERKPLYLPSDPVDEFAETNEADEDDHTDGPLKKKQKRSKAEKGKKCHSPSLGYMQGHLFQVLRPMIGTHTDVRDALAQSRPGDIAAFEHTLKVLEKAVKGGLQEYERSPEKFEQQPDETLKGSKAVIAEYGRPWWICQPYVRPLPEEAFEIGSMRAKGTKPPAKEDNKEKKEETDTPASETSAAPGSGAADTPTTTIDPLVSG